jgi:hypothetical protein
MALNIIVITSFYFAAVHRVFKLFQISDKIHKAELYIVLHSLVILTLIFCSIWYAFSLCFNAFWNERIGIFCLFASDISLAIILMFSVCRKNKIGYTPKVYRKLTAKDVERSANVLV